MFSNSLGRVEVSAPMFRKDTTASRRNVKMSTKRMKKSHIFI